MYVFAVLSSGPRSECLQRGQEENVYFDQRLDQRRVPSHVQRFDVHYLGT